MKKGKERRICANYAKVCPIANKCDNCVNRLIRTRFNRETQQKEHVRIECKKGLPTDGDKRVCFVCSNEGWRCKGE